MFKVFIIAFTSSIIFTWLAIKIANKFGIFDYPDPRKVHSRPIPLLGGIAVAASFFIAILLNFSFSWELKGIMIGAFFIVVSGLIDDVRGLSAFVRLLIQILCALIVVAFGVHIKFIPDCAMCGYPLEVFITVLWIVGITNAMNFFDGLDGLSSGIAAISAITFFIIAYQTGQGYFAFLNIALAGACLGFLFFNFHPAKIFLGDAGSSFLGFMLASLAVMGEWASGNPIVALSIPLLVLSILIFDMTYISAARILQKKVRNFKEWIEYVGKDHLHHRLMGMGFNQKHSVLLIYLINIVFALGVLAMKNATTVQAIILVLQGVCILFMIAILMIAGRGHLEKINFFDNHKDETSDDI